MNKVVLIGRLTKDPELKYTAGTGSAVTTFTLAVDRDFKNKEGQREADFINIVVWNKKAEVVANYLTKGKLVAVSGRIQTRSYEGNDGQRRYVTEVVMDDFQFLERKEGGPSAPKQTPPKSEGGQGDDFFPIAGDEDVPF